jgi:predicted DNA-binding transcriptional regulator YafY
VPRPAARVLALLEILQNGGTRSVPDLAARLGVDERTVRRYVVHLLDLDVPVESVRGRYGGYRLAPGYRLPPLMLTDDEALAVLVGLARSPRTGGSRLAAESASAKLRRVLPKHLAARMAALLDVADLPAAVAGAADASPDVDVLLVVAEAARDRRPVDLVHTSRAGVTTERTVQPYGVVAHANRWYLTGLDEGSGELRTFRLDRVVTARAGSGTFEVPEGFDPRAEVLASLARTPWRYAVSVLVHDEAVAVRARLPTGIATVAPVADREGWVRVEIRADRLDWVPSVLAALDAELVVEGPAELRDRVRDLGRRLLDVTGF